MKKPYNVPLRVKHFNKKVWNEEDLIYFDPSLGSDVNDPHNYTTRLFKRAMKRGRVLEVQDGWYRLYKNKGKRKVIVQGQSFLHILFYLEYRDQQEYDRWLYELNERENAAGEEMMKEIRALEAEEEAMEEQKAASGKGGFALEEKEGVTFIKNTNFVISKFL